MPDLNEKSFNDTFGFNSYQDGTYIHLAKADLIAPPGLSAENSWIFTPRDANESHELMLAIYHRFRVNQSQSTIAEVAITPFIKSAEFIETSLYDVWNSTFIIRVKNTAGQNPSPSLLIDP